jgi:phage gp46-like protein
MRSVSTDVPQRSQKTQVASCHSGRVARPLTQDEARCVEEAGLLTRSAGWWAPTRRSMGPVLRLVHREDTEVVMERAAGRATEALAELERGES